MSRPRNVIQYSLEGGEADPQYERRADADLWLITAKRVRNVRLTNGGGFKRRPGLARAAALDGAARFCPFVSREGDKRMLVLRDGELDVFETDASLEATETGAAWSDEDLATLQFAAENDRIIVASRSFFPQEILWDGSAFSVANLAWRTRADGSRGQPYYRFPDTKNITLLPGALTGAGITLVADADLFVADHVGVRFRILGRELQIATVVDAQNATANVIQPLYPTRSLTVTSSAGFSVGDQCLSSVDDIEMEVTGVPDGTHLTVLLTDGFTDPGTTSNKITGPNATTDITAVGSASIAATVQWDEALVSPVRGYPGGCLFHKGRLWLFDFPGAPELHAGSVLREPSDFDLGDGQDDEAIIDGPGDAVGRRVRHCVSSEQLLSLTENGSYYVGEGPNSPVTPTTVEFLRIGPEPAGDCNPVMAAEGAVFAEQQGERLMLLAPSGQLRRVWGATELLAMASEILISPKRLLLVDGCEWGPERYLLAINSDGSICAVHYRRDSEITGASLWTTPGGAFVDVGLLDRRVWAVTQRDEDYAIEIFDQDRLLDNSEIIVNTDGDVPEHASWADRTIALVWRATAGGEARRADIGEFDADGDGELADAPTSARTYEGGTRFAPLVTLWPPTDPEIGPSTWQRVAGVSLDILRSGQCYVAGQRLTPYRASDDVSAPPPLRTGWRKRRLLGRKRDFEVDVTQIEAAPLEVRCITLEVR